MKRRTLKPWRGRLCCVALALLMVCGSFAGALADDPGDAPGIPRVMLYEGYLTDETGEPLAEGAYDFRFSLYSTAEGGDPIWTEDHLAVPVAGGVVRVRLGDGTIPSPLDVPFDRQYFLGIRVGEDPEMVPRLELMPTAYAFRAHSADAVPDSSITAEKLAPLSVTDDKIESVSWAKITDVPDGPHGGGRGGGGGPSVPASVWHTKGNRNTDPERDYIGTADATDLSFRTDDLVRMKILSTGTVEIKSALLVEDYITSRKSPDEGGFLLADPDHGLKRVGNDDVRLFTTGGNVLLEGGNVGIGTPVPIAKLNVVSNVSGDAGQLANYPVVVQGVDHGIAVRVIGEADGDNNFVSFFDDDGVCGRIEGQTLAEYAADPVTIATDVYLGLIITAEIVASAAAIVEPSAIISLGAQIAYTGFLEIWNMTHVGVAYCSGGGDYAEWLPRLHEDEEIEAGDIVGVYGGRVTKRTDGAQQVLPVSSSPIVLGNMPPENTEHLFEPISFMGQVAVKVVGPVGEGDFIIPSGLGDGTGVALAPEMMTADEYAKAFGRAWTASDQDHVKLVNVAVGLDSGDVAAAVRRQESETATLREALASTSQEIQAVRSELETLREQILAFDDLAREVAQLRAAADEPRPAMQSDDAPVHVATDRSVAAASQ